MNLYLPDYVDVAYCHTDAKHLNLYIFDVLQRKVQIMSLLHFAWNGVDESD